MAVTTGTAVERGHRPKVSVLMIAYNVERTLHEAIDSVLMQEVDFDYETVIGEDCSTDGTRAIVEDYTGGVIRTACGRCCGRGTSG